MKRSHVGIGLGLLALLLVTVVGCSSLVDGKWAAKVNGDSILVTDYDARVAAAQTAYEAQGMAFDTADGKTALTQIKAQILSRMIEGKLIAQDVKTQKLNPEDATITAQEDAIKQNMGTDTAFQATLNQQGMSEPELKNFLTLYTKETADVKAPTEAEVKTFFDANSAKYAQAESVTAHHILLATEAEAKAIIVQLQTAQKNKEAILPVFEQLAKDKSTEDGAKTSGGSLGTFTKGQMVAEFETAAFAQKVGTFSTTPVKTKFGYHVIYIDAHTPAAAADYTKVKTQVEQDAFNQVKDTKFQTYFDDLHTKAKIEYAQGYKPAS